MSIVYQEEKKSDEENKLQILIEHITANSHANSEHEDIRYLRTALDNGDMLKGKILSGGYTNYSYQLYLKSNPDFRLFAKLCFAYALWSRGDERQHYDLERQAVEFNLMQRFSKEMGGPGKAPVATPYLLLDVPGEMRILVAQWAPADEQFANQFIEGHVDKRVLPKVARTLATITLAAVNDPFMNTTMKKNLSEMLDKPLDDEFDKLYSKSIDHDACIAYLNEIGRKRFDKVMKAWREADSAKQCMVHSDSHVFNMLVERKPDVTDLHWEEW